MFPPGKFPKSISRNAHYIVSFKNPRDQLGMDNLLLQAFPTQWQDVQDTFRKATERPFGYLLLDLHPKSSDDRRILSHLLKEERCMRCYQFKRVIWFPRFLPPRRYHLKWSISPGDMDYKTMGQILRCEGRRKVMAFLNSYKETAFTDFILSKLQLAQFLVEREIRRIRNWNWLHSR